jgi:hypothetical protein
MSEGTIADGIILSSKLIISQHAGKIKRYFSTQGDGAVPLNVNDSSIFTRFFEQQMRNMTGRSHVEKPGDLFQCQRCFRPQPPRDTHLGRIPLRICGSASLFMPPTARLI